MKASRRWWLFSLLVVSFLTSTACCTGVPRPEGLITPLGKLTPAVQAAVRYPQDGLTPDGASALMTVFNEKPELRSAFAGVPVQVWHDGHDVVLLVCAPDWSGVWLEDASWTLPVDELWYKQQTPQPLGFSLKPAQKGKP